jgi:hypothetical protein
LENTFFMKLHTIATLACILLSGCAFNVQKYGQIDPREKSITLPRGGDEVNKIIKEAAAQDGWRIYTWTDAVRTTGTAGQQVDIRSSVYAQARYSLKILSVRMFGANEKAAAVILTLGLGLPAVFEPSIHDLNLSVADNKTGQEILTITGSGYSDQLKQALIQGLK